MSDISQRPAQETMSITAPENRFSYDLGARDTSSEQIPSPRLQAIHDLIRSGEYQVSAAAIADRMIERMIADKRSRCC